MDMPNITIINGGVLTRPATATRESGLALRAEGKTYAEIARAWGISRSRVHTFLNPKKKK